MFDVGLCYSKPNGLSTVLNSDKSGVFLAAIPQRFYIVYLTFWVLQSLEAVTLGALSLWVCMVVCVMCVCVSFRYIWQCMCVYVCVCVCTAYGCFFDTARLTSGLLCLCAQWCSSVSLCISGPTRHTREASSVTTAASACPIKTARCPL